MDYKDKERYIHVKARESSEMNIMNNMEEFPDNTYTTVKYKRLYILQILLR